MSAIAKVLTKAFFHDGTFSSFRGREHGRPVDTLLTPSWRFVGYSQDHDQIGNRAIGDRLTAQLSFDDLAIAAVLVLTGPFTPMLFMGEEWAASTPWAFFTSHPDEELGEATRKGRLTEFARMGWDPNLVPDPQADIDVSGFQARLAEPLTGEHAEMLELYRELAVLRRSRPELTDPAVQPEHTDVRRRREVAAGRSFRTARSPSTCPTRPESIPLAGPAGSLLLATQAGAEVHGREPFAASRTPPSSSRRTANDTSTGVRQRPVIVRWLFGDQLGAHFLDSPDQRVLLIESRKVFARKRFHRQKAHLVLSAMRHRAAELGERCDYRRSSTYAAAVRDVTHDGGTLSVCHPTSYAALDLVRRTPRVQVLEARGFATSMAEFADWADSRGARRLLMEDHYRLARRRLDVLMDGDEPVGGRWNFDEDNRQPPPKARGAGTGGRRTLVAGRGRDRRRGAPRPRPLGARR